MGPRLAASHAEVVARKCQRRDVVSEPVASAGPGLPFALAAGFNLAFGCLRIQSTGVALGIEARNADGRVRPVFRYQKDKH